ncbi:MAG TPA: excinuclease ABC subunit UvrC [Clostridia bacterium]|nr:MAG: UvrABC system protein C [Firmicutes bacterium ADurb.Bin248]HOG00840.1 excinuclease ABC subunit UvrC [Clostridia bacterium]HOS18183.1 excinuclease ABC subunit UvrC [Clostridia bacterium]HPK14737.1 excinuclease ABC subunit UvrC [Clostridia bacterium]
MNERIAQKLKLLPDAPGVYRMLDAAGQVIYVGKAVNLKNRVRSYFRTDKNRSPKVAALVSHIADFEYILVANETEALTLEAAMTKDMQPRYNILLKDDKHFPYVRLDTKQDFPRFEVVRRAANDGARYFGPYLSAGALRDALNCISEDFPVRHCRKDIRRAITKNERPCLMYHLGKCCAPCSGKVSREEYHQLLARVCAFLEGDAAPVIGMLKSRMIEYSEALEFEKAARCRDRIAAIEAMGEKQRAMTATGAERDAFALARDGNDALMFAIFVRGGSIVGTRHFSMTCADEPAKDVTAAFLQQYYSESGAIPREVLVADMPDNAGELAEWLRSIRGGAVSLLNPMRGEKRELVDMARKNGQDTIQKQRELEHRAWERNEGALARLSAIIGLDAVPERVECFDNSHIRGRDTVSSMVVFLNGKPAPKEYRRFRIRQEAGGDDLAAMREALSRRFARAETDERFAVLPDLLIVDGGRTQLDAALDVLSEKELSHIPCIGLAERNEEIVLPDSDEPVVLGRGDGALHMLQRIRDEAHRFAITYHRSLHMKTALFSELDAIEGVGERRKRLLFDALVTRDAIASASVEQLAAVKGMTKPAAQAVYDYFHQPKENGE